jgi:hypothetical protein
MSRRPYITARRLADLAASLSERDRQVLATLGRVRVATAAQLERLHFTDVTRRQSRQVLTSLSDRRLVARLPRVVGGQRAGSAGYVYTLDLAGLRLVRPGRAWAARTWPVGTPFLAHSLAVTALYVELVEHERAGRLQVQAFTTEPGSWRRFHGPGGGRVVLKPDGIVVVRLGGYEDRWFIEVDRGTESRPTIARKCEVYRRYWQSGTEQARTGVFPRVLWIAPDQARADALVSVCAQQPAEAWRLFVVTTSAEAVTRLAQGAAS